MEQESLLTTRVVQSRSHYPQDLRTSQSPSYRKAVSPNTQADRGTVVFQYSINYSFTRHHFNPPIWHDSHPHDYTVTLFIQSPRHDCDMYGIDMVEVEKLLQSECESLPEVINDLLPSGTTEDMCLYFSSLQLPDKQAKIIKVSVSETPERITILEV